MDLGSSQPLSTVKIWNRTDCCANRLTDYWLFASDTPFDPSRPPAQQAGWSSHQITQAGAPTTITVGRSARYLMVQQSSATILSLAEVEAYPQLAVTNGVYTLTSVGSGRNLDDPGSSTAPGTQLIQWPPHAGANQQWRFTGTADGSFTIANGASGLCAGVVGASTASGAAVAQLTCDGSASQRWTVSNGTIRAVHSGLSLTVAGLNDLDPATQATDTASNLQRWTLVRVG